MAGVLGVHTGALLTLLPKLGALLAEEYNLQRSVKGEILFLKAELESMLAALLNVSDLPRDQLDVWVKLWARDVRELSYDFEDSVDDFMVRTDVEDSVDATANAKPRPLRGFLERSISLLQKARIRRQIASSIKDIKSVVREVGERRYRYKVQNIAAAPIRTTMDPLLSSALFTSATELVGIEGPLEKLTEWLTKREDESAQWLKVVSIVGMGGVGKTTLASQVYRRINSQFHCCAFLSVSQAPDMNKILRTMLSEVGCTTMEVTEDELGLIEGLRKFLHDKRYLIIVDDLWSVSSWEYIKCALPENNKGSRIITTTRVYDVARLCCSHWDDMVYGIQPLSEADSIRLFCRRIFGSEDGCPPDLMHISLQILKKCSGLPLAIISTASVLAFRPHTTMEWQNTLNYIGSSQDGGFSLEVCRQVLCFGYDNLPEYLKTCFLYLSIFPVDYVVKRDSLVRRWIAEGFIQEQAGCSRDEVGKTYFNELVNRSMIQPVDISYDGEVGGCRVHDMVLDFIVYLSSEENFATLLGDGKSVSLQNKIRRLSLIGCTGIDEEHFLRASMNVSHIRSLTVFGRASAPLSSLMEFHALRILDLEGCHDLENYHLENINRLRLLKYLSIKDTPISKLPEQIGEVPSMETLDLRGTRVEKFPTSFAQLQRLEYLLCDSVEFPAGIGKMQALSLLLRFDIFRSSVVAVEEMANLINLRVLHIHWYPDKQSIDTKDYEEKLVSSLTKLLNLQSVFMDGNNCSIEFLDGWSPPTSLQKFHMDSGCYVPMVPKWITSLMKLTHVCVNAVDVMVEDLQLLGVLPGLLHLSLSSSAMRMDVTVEELIIHSSYGFQRLVEFNFDSERAYLTFKPSAMPKLKRLMLSFHVLAAETSGFAFSIGQLMSLKEVEIRINGDAADASRIKAAETALRNTLAGHPNSPAVNIVILSDLVDEPNKDEEGEEQKFEACASATEDQTDDMSP